MESQTQSQSEMVVVTSGDLLPIVNKYFDQISSAQWSLISSQTCDSISKGVLADMLTEMIQSLAKAALEHILKSPSLAEITAPLENIKVCLGDSLHSSFAVALRFPQEKCLSAEKLTAMVEIEVAENVHSVLSVAINSSVWPSEPALSVSGSMSNAKTLSVMVFHATECLKTYSSKIKSKCQSLCWRLGSTDIDSHKITECPPVAFKDEQERCGSSQSVKSQISVLSATEAVTEILVKCGVNTSVDAHLAASEMANNIISDLHYMDNGNTLLCSEKSDSAQPELNTGLILDEGKCFYASQATSLLDMANNREKVCEDRVLAEKRFEKMKEELKSGVTKGEADFLVELTQHSQSSLLIKAEEDEFNFPGMILQPQRPTSEASCLTTPMINVSKKHSSSVHLEMIKKDIDSLYSKVNLPKTPAKQNNAFPNYEIKKFSKELTDKLYDHLMPYRTYQIPLVQTGKCLSDTVISSCNTKCNAVQTRFSPEVLYVMTEDAVRKFLQQVLLWLEKDQSVKTLQSDQISGAVTDIEGLITTMLKETSVANSIINQESYEEIPSQTSKPSCPPPEVSYSVPAEPCKETCFGKSRTGESAVSMDASSLSTEEMTKNLISLLIRRLFLPVPYLINETQEKVITDSIIQRLCVKWQDKNIIPISAVSKIKDEEQLKKIIKGTIKDMIRTQGHNRYVRVHMETNNPLFDDALMEILKTHVKAPISPSPKKSAVATSFSKGVKNITKHCKKE